VVAAADDSGAGDGPLAGHTAAEHAAAVGASGAATTTDISAAAGKGIAFEKYQMPDPTLPSPPVGAVKHFRVDVYEHVTKVADDLAPTRVWSYGVNGEFNRGTGVSQPMVVAEDDKVEIELVNGGSKAMDVRMPHSIDFHSSEVAPNEAFVTIQPGETHEFSFVAKHPGVYMYHCATDPVLHHTGAGMVGMMVVKPDSLAPVNNELWITQQEYYLGTPGEDADLAKMEAKQPDVLAFNGYANQYKDHPIALVPPVSGVRMYVLNAGPTQWSAFM
jgi:nitrite reductase (NO-forming)